MTQWWHWVGFNLLVLVLLAFDLGVLHKNHREVGVKESLWLSFGYFVLALCFSGVIFHFEGRAAGVEFLTGYLIEKSLSIDNIFVFVLIFTHFQVPKKAQHTVLFWGVLGALVMRAALILAGAAVLSAFHWVIYVFGAFLILTGVKMLMTINEVPDLSGNRVTRFMRRHFRVTEGYEGERFVVLRDGVRLITPLLIVLVLVEFSDVVFALDSIPAIFAITKDPFLVYTSNVFAILGLRALFFALAGIIHRFHYLKYGLSIVLVVVGGKMVVNAAFGHVIPTEWALLLTAAIIGSSVALSVYRTRGLPAEAAETVMPRGWVPGSPPKDEPGADRK
ncbi:tellurite resistance protein TerC [Humidesulfovibrio mexicanus]|uniref:Tellurite resistance protein TerC n=1 Tax=Humidesulfovibrio mexicanus TaxID=147047 RepID=A0A238YAK4_9BACT|nr:TerC family protein [Humidesulfovibrio mexicanus]SNR68167.1 tellurite resistance protein TerC [Humidesulfovibrio mexicanus]